MFLHALIIALISRDWDSALEVLKLNGYMIAFLIITCALAWTIQVDWLIVSGTIWFWSILKNK